MSILVLKLEPIIARIKDQVSKLRMVEGAAQLEAAFIDGPRTNPAAFVVPLSEDASRNPYGSGATSQHIIDRFAVVIAIKNARDPRGATAFDGGLRDVRLAVMAALTGWDPDIGFEPCEYDGGSIVRLAGGMVWWRDRYLTGHHNRV